eukprot:CAMPEP_0174900798 /NCGR_PEP_ID=MMETSP0167-20121228/32574_1 /TAXON_ID=38298 /ORGANISM="Rhodella maculata, Strain CCMP736" /LENGTH=105 /DNA_ID=CAMNT_0016142307 /DNA_START=299 /DNA_END=612 /DNA_ORIENTATION=+
MPAALKNAAGMLSPAILHLEPLGSDPTINPGREMNLSAEISRPAFFAAIPIQVLGPRSYHPVLSPNGMRRAGARPALDGVQTDAVRCRCEPPELKSTHRTGHPPA